MAKRTRTAAARPRSTRKTPRTPAPRKRPGPLASAGREFQKLVDIMARLRGPGGCPWDREQTIESLRSFVLEETYEVLDAIDRGDHDALVGEIGDLLFEGVFLAQIEHDEGRFTVSDSLRAISTKLIRRHPHVFGKDAGRVDDAGPGARAVGTDQSAGAEGRRRAPVAPARRAQGAAVAAARARDRLPRRRRWLRLGARQPRSWTRSRKRSPSCGARWTARAQARAEEEMGDLLFSIANLARKLGIEPESALRKANDKFSARFEALEQAFESRGQSVHDATLEEMEAEWQRIKVLKVLKF